MSGIGGRIGPRFCVSALVTIAAVGVLGGSLSRAAPAPCPLVPQLRDVTVNQGLGTYSPLVNGKETIVRFYLSKPSCAGSGASIQVTGGTLTVSGGGTISAPTPVPISPAFPEIATFTVAAMADSTGDPKFVVPASMVTRTGAFTASFSATINYRQRASSRVSYASASVPFTNRPGTNNPISASFDKPSNALGVLFVPMGDASKTYNTQWTATGQQALQDGMTAAIARAYPLAAGIGNLGGTGGLRYAVAPTLLDLKRLNLLNADGKFCGTGASYNLIKAELAQFRLSYNTENPSAQANRVVGVIDPSIALLPPNPCFEAMAVVNSQEAWSVAAPGRAGQTIGLELAHTLGLVPPARESPFDGAHSQNITAENPQVNRRFNVVQRSFIPADRSLMKPSATSPTPDNVNTLLEAPDFAFLLCVLGGSVNTECQTFGQPGSVDASAPVGSTLAFVMSGTTDGDTGICATCTGAAAGTDVIESYFASSVPLTTPSSTSTYRLVQRTSGGAIVSDQGVPLFFRHSEHGTGSGSTEHTVGLFSLALPFQSTADRVELWNGSPGASGSLLLYAQNRTATPAVTSFDVGAGPILTSVRGNASTLAVETLSAQTAAPTAPTTITPGEPLSTSVSFGSSFSSVSSLCVNWYFIGDLFDPEETVTVSWAGGGGGGAGNIVGGPRRTQQLCMGEQTTRDLLLDGTEALTLGVSGGSVTVGAVVISVGGDSTQPLGYRISSDSPSYTVAQGSSVSIATTVTDDPVDPDEPGVELFAQALVPSGGFSTEPSGGVPTFASDGTLTTSASTPPDTYWLVVTGTGGGFTRSYAVPVTVTASGGGATYTVNTNTDPAAPLDSGCTTDECTLREAIDAANAAAGSDTIVFDLPLSDGTQIAPTTALPPISDTVLIDGDSQPEGDVVVNGDGAGFGDGFALDDGSDGSTIRGIEIRDFSNGAGIRIGSANNTIVSNTIHDTSDGIVVSGSDATGNVIGDNVGPGDLFSIDYALGNVLVNNFSDGLEISSGATGTVVAGNFIGTDRIGATGLGNDSTGIRVAASGNQLGPGNTVVRNGSVDTGIFVASGSGNRIVANSIHDNLGLGISLGEGANNDLGAPALTSATPSGGTTTVQGTVSGPPAGDYFVEFFRNGACDASDFGEGETYLDFTTVSVSGPSTSFSYNLGGLSIGDVLTATLTSAATSDTSEFSTCVTVAEAAPAGQEPWDATATDDNAGDMRLDGFLDCPGQPVQVIFVGRAPNSVSGNTATWTGTIDTSLAPPNCAVKIAVNDGFTRPPITATGTETAATGNNPLVAAVSSPRQDAELLQYGVIPLRGSIFNAQGVLDVFSHAWSLSGPGGITRSGTSPIVDLQPPTGGWPAGTYTATLQQTGSTDPGDSVTFTVLTDADNDGIPKSVEDACIGGNGDNDPLNAFGDRDNDGMPNANDPQPCTAATSYTAIVDVNPDPLPTGSSGNPITADVRVPGRNVAQVLASSVRITRIADEDVSTNNDFKNIAWTIKNGVGIAKFDRMKVAAWLASRNIHNRVVSITVSGSSGAPPWTFSGADSVFVQG